MKVLLLEDEKSIRDFVRINLQRAGFEVVEADTGEDALRIALEEDDIGIAILDVMLSRDGERHWFPVGWRMLRRHCLD